MVDPNSIPIQRAVIGGLGPWELVIILVIILIIFGAGKLPQIGGAVGQALKAFKKASGPEAETKKKEPESAPRGDTEKLP